MSDEKLINTKNILAGNAKFSIRHDETGERYTYWLNVPKIGKNKGVIVAKLLTGQNNEADYTEIGTIDSTTGELTLTGKIGNGETRKEVPTSVALIRWFVKLAIEGKDVPSGVTLHHSGRCLACGRTLTVEYPTNPYRIWGLGPECGSK